MSHRVTWLAAVILTVLALPSLLARLAGGHPPLRIIQLAALAPVAAVPATVAVIVAAFTSGWLAVVLAVPAVTLLAWQLPPARRPARVAARPGPATAPVRLRVLSVNALGGAADPAAVLRLVQQHHVDVLAVQELTPEMVGRLDTAGLARLLPFAHLDARPGSPGTGLWGRWPLTPLPPVPGLVSAAPRARTGPPGGPELTVTAVHPMAPMKRSAAIWQHELAVLRQVLTETGGPHIMAGDFNASRDHRPFRDLLAAGFTDCADAGRSRRWPAFTWPAIRYTTTLPVMRLDHILVPRTATVHLTRAIRIPRTDHYGVLADIELA